MTERELNRHAAHRLAIIRHAQELTGNVSKTCRYYGSSRQVYYKWLRRYEEGGLEAVSRFLHQCFGACRHTLERPS